MPSKPPTTPEEHCATGVLSPEFEAAWKEKPIPPWSSYKDIQQIKKAFQARIPITQKALADSRPNTLTESEHNLVTRDGWQSRTIICHPTEAPSSNSSPLIVLFYGGSHCFGFPELELRVARELAIKYNAVVAMPSYRLAPEFPFPHSTNDSWDCLQALAAETLKAREAGSGSAILPPFTDARHAGFIVGGSSAGANLAASLAHLARDLPLSPPLTGQCLFAGSYMHPDHVPPKYQPFYLSRTQDFEAFITDKYLSKMTREAFNADPTSPLWALFDQHNPKDAPGEVKEGHMRLCPAYFQVCGMDLSRDDGLIYERVLREESGVRTRLDLYSGFPHCWWGFYLDLEMSKKRMRDTLDGFEWLLELHKSEGVTT